MGEIKKSIAGGIKARRRRAVYGKSRWRGRRLVVVGGITAGGKVTRPVARGHGSLPVGGVTAVEVEGDAGVLQRVDIWFGAP